MVIFLRGYTLQSLSFQVGKFPKFRIFSLHLKNSEDEPSILGTERNVWWDRGNKTMSGTHGMKLLQRAVREVGNWGKMSGTF